MRARRCASVSISPVSPLPAACSYAPPCPPRSRHVPLSSGRPSADPVAPAPSERPRPLHLAWRRAGVRAERRYELGVSEVLAVPGLQAAVGDVGEGARGGVGVLAVGGWRLLVSGDRLVPVACDSSEGV